MQCGKRDRVEIENFSLEFFFWLNTMFSSLAEGTIVVKIENTIFTFYFDIRFSIFIVAIFQSGSNPASIYLFKITKETLEKHVKYAQS